MVSMASDSSRAFSFWIRRMGYSYKDASDILDLCPAVIANYRRGSRRERVGEDERPVHIPLVVLLACSAIEARLEPIKPPEV